MANDITPSSSSWATTSMKPATDEEATALWAQNIADNEGYLFNLQSRRRWTLFSFPVWYAGNGTYGTAWLGLTGGAAAGTFFDIRVEAHPGIGTFIYRFMGSAPTGGTFHVKWLGAVGAMQHLGNDAWTQYSGTIVGVGVPYSNTFLICGTRQADGAGTYQVAFPTILASEVFS